MEAVLLSLVYRNLPEMIALCLVLAIQAAGVWWILRGSGSGVRPWARRFLPALLLATFAVECGAELLRFARVSKYFPPWFASWGRGMVIAYALCTVLFIGVLVVTYAVGKMLSARKPAVDGPARRRFLQTAQTAILAAPAIAVGYGMFIERRRLVLREQSILIPALPKDLEGLRIVQLTDIHLSPFLRVSDLEHAVGMANETRANIALVTGDLITSTGDPLDTCLGRLSKVRADAGVLGCLGNHEVYARAEEYVAEQGARLGLRFLRQTAEALRFGNTTLNVAGVDYQKFGSHYLAGAEQLVQTGAFNMLLSHNPDVFPVAARQGYQLTISGHTHGGQVRVEILHQNVSIARFFTPYVDGLYRSGSSAIFVSRGIGTIGIPARLGCTPEVALVTLCRA